MADTIFSREGDTLDALIARDRSIGPADLVAVLEANPGLAAGGALLPIGTAVRIPPLVSPSARTLPVIQLWN